VGEAVPVELRLAHEDYAGATIRTSGWTPTSGPVVVGGVTEALVAAHPEDEAAFRANAAAHLADLERLSAYADEVLGAVPAEARVLVTAHDAFNYFGRSYGFEVVGIQGISTQSEAGLNRVGEIVDLLVDRGWAPSSWKARSRTGTCAR
jgi:manganese/zinc/iron transport system substrate-binding protein